MTSRFRVSGGIAAAVAVGHLAFAACRFPESPSDLNIPLLDQQHVFACGQWTPADPPIVVTVVDIQTNDPSTDPGPSRRALDAIRAAGGTIVHVYNIPMARAIIDPRRAAALAGFGADATAQQVATVTDREVFDVSLIVVLESAVTDEDIADVEALGARVIHRYTVIPGYAAVAPDRIVPAIRRLPRVEHVEASVVGCLSTF